MKPSTWSQATVLSSALNTEKPSASCARSTDSTSGWPKRLLSGPAVLSQLLSVRLADRTPMLIDLPGHLPTRCHAQSDISRRRIAE